MKIRSAKNKGQRASREVKELLLSKFPELQSDDIHVTPASVNGCDIVLSPRAQQVVAPLDIEVKNQESVSGLWSWLKQAKANSAKGTPVVAFRKNREKLHVCLEFEKFLDFVRGAE